MRRSRRSTSTREVIEQPGGTADGTGRQRPAKRPSHDKIQAWHDPHESSGHVRAHGPSRDKRDTQSCHGRTNHGLGTAEFQVKLANAATANMVTRQRTLHDRACAGSGLAPEDRHGREIADSAHDERRISGDDGHDFVVKKRFEPNAGGTRVPLDEPEWNSPGSNGVDHALGVVDAQSDRHTRLRATKLREKGRQDVRRDRRARGNRQRAAPLFRMSDFRGRFVEQPTDLARTSS